LLWLQKKGKQTFGEHFKIFEGDKPLLHKMLSYFLRDELEAQKWHIDLEKVFYSPAQ